MGGCKVRPWHHAYASRFDSSTRIFLHHLLVPFRCAPAVHNCTLHHPHLDLHLNVGIPCSCVPATLLPPLTHWPGCASGALLETICVPHVLTVASPAKCTHVQFFPLLMNPGQVCASGALLNIVGPDLDALPRQPGGPGAQRRGLGRLMALAMAAAAIHDCVFERQPELS